MEVPIQFGLKVNDWEKATQSPDGYLYRKDLPAGAGEWCVFEGQDKKEVRYLYYTCPCGCGSMGPLPVVSPGRSDGWSWNNSLDKPTVTPSIQKLTPCRWHGYLTDGVFKQC